MTEIPPEKGTEKSRGSKSAHTHEKREAQARFGNQTELIILLYGLVISLAIGDFVRRTFFR